MKTLKIILGVYLVGSVSVFADITLSDTVDLALKNNQDIVSKTYNNEAFKMYIDEQKGSYYPKLDLTGKLEKKRTKEEYDNGTSNTTNAKGLNGQLQLEQLIYDKKVSSKIDTSNHRYKSNKYKNQNDIEIVILNSIDSFLNINKFQKRIVETNRHLSTLNNSYKIAEKTEIINEETLDKVQTKAKIYSSRNRLLAEKNNENIAKSYFLKNVGVEVKEQLKDPNISNLKLASLEELEQKAAKNNYLILAQIERIKQKRAVIQEENGEFLPTLKFKLQGTYDKDLMKNDTKTKLYSARVELKYNIFNGFINQTRTQREKIFLKEAQSELNVVTNEVLNELRSAYYSYKTSKQQIEELRNLIIQNKEIVRIYKDQFNSGVRSFIDLLNVQNDLFNSRIDLINAKTQMYRSFFKVLQTTSSLEIIFSNSKNI